MGVLARLRAYAGLWTLVALLGGAMVFVAAAAGPAGRQVEDRALRQLIAEAPPAARSITVSELAVQHPTSAGQMRRDVAARLAPVLAEAVGTGWGIQRTRISQPELAASVTGDGIATSGPAGFMPLAALHHQTDLLARVSITAGRAPRTGAEAIEVVTSTEVAGGLGLRVGSTYHLLPGVAARSPLPADQALGPVVAFTLVGVFEPVDPAGAEWELDPALLHPGVIQWNVSGDLVPLARATLVTDQAGIDALARFGLTDPLGVENVARFAPDASRLDAGWAGPAAGAVAELLTDPSLRTSMRVDTGLLGLLAEFGRQAAAARALAAAVTAGLVAVGAGLLVLAARLTLDRRRDEVWLLRARGASALALVARLLGESAVVVLPAAVLGWLLHLLVARQHDQDLLAGVGPAPLVAVLLALLAVPVGLAVDQHRRAGLTRGTGGRAGLRRYRGAPVRITVELVVALLAGLGVLLLHRRGLTATETADPYLSAAPVFVAVTAGLLALRLIPWPLRALGAVTARRRGVVGFLGFARAGRAPATGLPLLVLVLAVALGGFAGAVYGSVAAARDAVARQSVGADARVAGEGLTGEAMTAVAAVAGVDEVAAVRHGGFLRVGGRVVQDLRLVTVDAAAYQRILAAIGAPTRLPDRVVSAGPGAEPVPVLGDRRLAGSAGRLTVEVDGTELPAELVGEVAGLPDLAGGDRWVLVPRQALPAPTAIDELLTAGPDADPAALREAAGGGRVPVEVLTRDDHRAMLEASGFNQGFTLVFVVGTVGGGLGGLLAVGLALVVQAASRSHALSLLRTMGLSSRQARGLLLVELTPATAIAVVAGAAIGIALPVLLAPALGLSEFAGGAPVEVGLDPRTVGLLAGLLGMFLVGGALIEAAVNRRLGLGQVLRVD